MKTLLSLLALGMLVSGCSHTVKMRSESKYEGHPVVGAWYISVNGCTETYVFLPDGTLNSTSAQETVKASYTISEAASEQGFYKLRDTVLEDNGKTDCSGSTENMTGDIVDLYIAFNPGKDQMLFCLQENFEKCFGPFRRK